MTDGDVDDKGDKGDAGDKGDMGAISNGGVVSIISNNEKSKIENKALKKKLKAIHFGFESIFMGKSIGFQCFGKFSDVDSDEFIGYP